VHEIVEREPKPFGFDDLAEGSAAGIQLGSMKLESIVIGNVREGNGSCAPAMNATA
jgi:hypothetical protein